MSYSKGKFFPAVAAYCFCLLLTLTTAYAVNSFVIRVQVDQVELSNPRHPELRAKVLKAPPDQSIPEKRVVLQVDFTSGSDGCIDWTDNENRSKAMVLGLKPGDILEAEVKKEKNAFLVTRLNYVGAGSEVYFPGREKIRQDSILKAFVSPESRVQVIVSLACAWGTAPQDGAKPPDQVKSRINHIQDNVLASLPEGEFKLENRMENVPVMSGQITLKGLKALAAHHLVSSIEEDRPLQLNQPATGGIK